MTSSSGPRGWSTCRPAVECYRRRQMTTTTDASEQNNTGPLGGPVMIDTLRAYVPTLLQSRASTWRQRWGWSTWLTWSTLKCRCWSRTCCSCLLLVVDDSGPPCDDVARWMIPGRRHCSSRVVVETTFIQTRHGFYSLQPSKGCREVRFLPPRLSVRLVCFSVRHLNNRGS